MQNKLYRNNVIKTKKLTSDKVTAHEHLGQFLGVLVLGVPDGIVFGVELLPEVRNGDGLILIRVAALEIIHVEGTETFR